MHVVTFGNQIPKSIKTKFTNANVKMETMRGKVLIQRLWKQKLSLDQIVPRDECLEWQKLRSNLENYSQSK